MQLGVKHAIADFTPDTPESASCSKARAVARLVNSCGEKVVKRQHILGNGSMHARLDPFKLKTSPAPRILYISY